MSTSASTRRRRAPRGSGEQLRAEIIAAAKALLAETGSAEDVSIRAVADRVNVTSPSIYLHFADKGALLDAVVEEVFADMHEALRSAMAGIASPLERLCACGQAYVQFARDHPEQYRLATMDPSQEPPSADGVIMDAAFVQLNTAITDCMRDGIFAEGDPLPIALDLWATAHGIASLMIAKPYVPWGDADAVILRVLAVAALGNIARGLVGNDDSPAAILAWLKTVKR